MSLWKWWMAIAGTALVVGGVAWLLKLAVIVATGGRVVDTGAAAVFYLLGFLLLVIGSTGIGLWLTTNRAVPLRIAAVVLSRWRSWPRCCSSTSSRVQPSAAWDQATSPMKRGSSWRRRCGLRWARCWSVLPAGLAARFPPKSGRARA